MPKLFHYTAQMEVPLLPPLGANLAHLTCATGHWIWPQQRLPCQEWILHDTCFFTKLASNGNATTLGLNGLHSSSNLGCEVGSLANTGKCSKKLGSLKKMARYSGNGGRKKKILLFIKGCLRDFNMWVYPRISKSIICSVFQTYLIVDSFLFEVYLVWLMLGRPLCEKLY